MKNKEAVTNVTLSGLSFLAGILGLIAAVKNIRAKDKLPGVLLAAIALLNIALGVIHSVKYLEASLRKCDDDCDFVCETCPKRDTCPESRY